MPYVGNTAQKLVTADDVTVTDDLTVTDDASVGGDLTVTGTTTVAAPVVSTGQNASHKKSNKSVWCRCVYSRTIRGSFVSQ